jgi:hypothetical protein
MALGGSLGPGGACGVDGGGFWWGSGGAGGPSWGSGSAVEIATRSLSPRRDLAQKEADPICTDPADDAAAGGQWRRIPERIRGGSAVAGGSVRSGVACGGGK